MPAALLPSASVSGAGADAALRVAACGAFAALLRLVQPETGRVPEPFKGIQPRV